MGKNKQLYNLRLGISIKSERVKYLLETIAYNEECSIETQIFADMALDEIKKISKMSEEIGKILKH